MNTSRLRRRSSSASSLRRQRGVIMATMDLVIMIPVVVAATLFMVDCSLGSYYKERISFVSMQASNFAANLPPEQEPSKPTEKLVNDLLKRMNSCVSGVKVSVKPITVGDQDGVCVTVFGTIPLLRGGLLRSIDMQETSVTVYPANRVCAAIAITPYPYSYTGQSGQQQPSVYIPVIQPRHQMPIWQFPYDTAINNLHITQGCDQGIANRSNTYFPDHPSLY